MIEKKVIEDLTKHFNDYILSDLKDNNIKCWLSGGILRDFLLNEESKTDCDLFFPNNEEFVKACKYFSGNGYDVIWESMNGVKFQKGEKVFDIVKKYFPTPSDTIQNFDFTMCQFAFDGNNLIYNKLSYKHLMDKQMVINKIIDPSSTILRALRFSARGFTMNKSNSNRLCELIKTTPLIISDNDSPISGDIFTYKN